MEVITLLVFVSGTLVFSALLFYLWSVRTRHHDHSDRLALLPLREDGPKQAGTEPDLEARHER
jgi:cbb3-type cytochrome oxidase maturation protein